MQTALTDKVSAPTARNVQAQGNALGFRMHKISKALKARNRNYWIDSDYSLSAPHPHLALSTLRKIKRCWTWADGPGFHISRRWR